MKVSAIAIAAAFAGGIALGLILRSYRMSRRSFSSQLFY